MNKNKLLIIDGLGPFVKKGEWITNWSSAPLYMYENREDLDKDFEQIVLNFEKFCKKVGKIGCNTISIDDLAHAVLFLLKSLYRNFQKLKE